MSDSTTAPASVRQEATRMRTFLDRLFWTLGIFCFLWAQSAVIGVLRRRDSDLPIIGKTQINETIVFTLLCFSVLVPLLLLVVHAYRDAAAKFDWETQFPGTPSGEWEIPASFKRLRVGIFAVLVVFPAATMIYLCAVMPKEMKFKDIRHDKTESNANKVELPGDRVELNGAEIFLGPLKPFPFSDPDWRWIETGTQSNEEKTLARPSAYRWQPWFFSLVAGGCGCVSLYYLFFSSGKRPRREPPKFV